MNAAPAVRHLTVEEYLAMEDVSTEKHEFVAGVVHAMAGASFPHNQIFSNAHGEIYSFLKDKHCRVYGSDLKVHAKNKSAFVYPDLTIVCDGAQFLEGKKGIITNPSVIIEVLSEDTKNYDRGEKFMLYRQVETLQEYILISSLEVLIEKFKKQPSGSWLLTDYRNGEDVVEMESIGFRTTLTELYRDVVFDEAQESGTAAIAE